MKKEVTLRYLSRSEQDHVAQEVVAEMRRRAGIDGDAPLTENDIHNAMVRMNVILTKVMFPMNIPGQFITPEEAATASAVIQIADGATDPQELREKIHELAHFLMYEWVAPNLYDAEIVYCTDQDPRKTRHKIAKRAEQMALLPIFMKPKVIADGD